jgi:hypothetical protein
MKWMDDTPPRDFRRNGSGENPEKQDFRRKGNGQSPNPES